MKTNAITYDEQKIFEEMKRVGYGVNIIFKQVFIQNTYPAKVLKVNGDTATFLSKRGNEYEVMLSDRVKYEGIKAKDEAIITVLSNGNWIVSHINEIYDEEKEKKELERQLKDFEDLLGGY